MSNFDMATGFSPLFLMGMSRTEEYLPWAEIFIQARRVVAVRIDTERGEYAALSETGSSFFIERLEQAQALLQVLQAAEQRIEKV
jgi:hypothetical protein